VFDRSRRHCEQQADGRRPRHTSRLAAAVLRRSKRLGYCRIDQLEVADVFSAADDDFFGRIKSNSLHVLVLQPYLPDDNEIPYQLHAHTISHLGSNQYKKPSCR